MLASRAAPPSRAPIAMAPVWMGAAPVLEEVVVVVVVDVSWLVSEASSDESEDLSEPVAVRSTDDTDEMELLRREDEMELRSELRDDASELLSDEMLDDAEPSGLVEVVVEVMVEVKVSVVVRPVLVEVMVEVVVSVVVWAAASEARARAATARRMLAVCWCSRGREDVWLMGFSKHEDGRTGELRSKVVGRQVHKR